MPIDHTNAPVTFGLNPATIAPDTGGERREVVPRLAVDLGEAAAGVERRAVQEQRVDGAVRGRLPGGVDRPVALDVDEVVVVVGADRAEVAADVPAGAAVRDDRVDAARDRGPGRARAVARGVERCGASGRRPDVAEVPAEVRRRAGHGDRVHDAAARRAAAHDPGRSRGRGVPERTSARKQQSGRCRSDRRRQDAVTPHCPQPHSCSVPGLLSSRDRCLAIWTARLSGAVAAGASSPARGTAGTSGRDGPIVGLLVRPGRPRRDDGA